MPSLPEPSGRQLRLPRGPHSLTREEVAAHQRHRIMEAMADVAGDKGYLATTVSDVTTRASVSRGTFYAHFANKQECLLATYDAIVADGFERVATASRQGEGFSASVAAGARALFELASERPRAMRVVMVEIAAAGSDGAERREGLISICEQVLREGLGLPYGPGTIPNPVLRAVVGGLNKVIYGRVQSGAHAELHGLVPDLVAWGTSYYPVPRSMREAGSFQPALPGTLSGGRAPGTLTNMASIDRIGGKPLRDASVSRSFVVHSQRERILDAVANLSAAKGYMGFTVDNIAEEASVSLEAFYEHFQGKEDAFLVAYEVGHSKGLTMVERAYATAPDWREGMRAAIAALFDFLASEPAFAHVALIDALIATPQTAERASRGAKLYAQMLLPGMEESTKRSQAPPAVTIEAIAGGVLELCSGYALQGRIAELPELVPRATYFALAPFIGAEEAGRIAMKGSLPKA